MVIHSVCVDLLALLNSLPLTEIEGGEGRRRRRRKGMGRSMCVFVCNRKSWFDQFYRNAYALFLTSCFTRLTPHLISNLSWSFTISLRSKKG